MATTGIFPGHLMGLYIGGVRIAATTGVQFSLAANMREVNNAQTGDVETVVPGRRSVSASGSSHFQFDAGYGVTNLIAAWKAGTKLTAKVSTESVGDPTYTFDGYIEKFDADFPDHENSTYSFSIRGTSDVTIGAVSS